ncbi:unnamed protein product [Prunus armeniaca]|uniref:Uncharacterized protein n=2 Tax=Prunus armeniaca TaxID=36596 RepID=A0A6J5X530_PRUAR|nr:hypothetical protein GBA52_012398 [Prunus armeniaca]CAB4307042.1 unnamed protein product [Prunus armeniaca]
MAFSNLTTFLYLLFLGPLLFSFHLCLASRLMMELKKPSTTMQLGSDPSSPFSNPMKSTLPFFQDLPNPVENMNTLLPFPGFPTIPKIPPIPKFPFIPTMPSVNPFLPQPPVPKNSESVISRNEAKASP